MDINKAKQKLIDMINSSNDEVLLVELLDVVKHHDVVAGFSDEQQIILKQRMANEKAGKGIYEDARKAVQDIKSKLKDV